MTSIRSHQRHLQLTGSSSRMPCSNMTPPNRHTVDGRDSGVKLLSVPRGDDDATRTWGSERQVVGRGGVRKTFVGARRVNTADILEVNHRGMVAEKELPTVRVKSPPRHVRRAGRGGSTPPRHSRHVAGSASDRSQIVCVCGQRPRRHSGPSVTPPPPIPISVSFPPPSSDVPLHV